MLKVDIINLGTIGVEPAHTILENCKWEIVEGKTYILLGSNGSGKTTFSFALTGLTRSPFEVKGSVFFRGKDLLNCNADELLQIRKKKIKYVFQDPVSSFDPLKRFGYYFKMLEIPEEKIDSLLDFFLLPEYSRIKRLFPHEISVGMAQRIAICLAFLPSPDLVIMDEPNSALDAASGNLLVQKIKEFTGSGSSVLIITQDLNFANNLNGDKYIIKEKKILPFKQ